MLSNTEAGSPITQDDVAQANFLAVGPPANKQWGQFQDATPAPVTLGPAFTGIKFSTTTSRLFAALAAARAKFGAIKKDTANPFFKSKYADLAALIEATVPALSENGLVVIQAPSVLGNLVTVTSLLSHSSGEYIVNELTFTLADKATPQTIGSAVTYARRYSYQSLLNLAAEEDDDGNAASGKEVQKEPAKPRQSVDHKPAQPAERPRPNDKPVHSSEQTKTNQPQPLAEELDPLPTPLELDNFKKKIRDLSGGGRPDKEKFLKLAGAEPGTDPNKLSKQQWEKAIAAMEAGK